MDTKSIRRRKEKVKRNPLLRSIDFQSMAISAIFHTLLLLSLALICFNDISVVSPIVLNLTFSEKSDELITEDFLSSSIEIETIEESLNNVAETLSSIESQESSINIETPSIEVPLVLNSIRIDSDNLMQEIDIPSPAIGPNGSMRDNQPVSGSAETAINRFNGLLKAGTTIASHMNPGVLHGSNNEFEHKLNMYGAKTGDIQISLSWNTYDDIDLYVDHWINNNAESISWHNRLGNLGGMLDIDMNAGVFRQQNPIENVFWPLNTNPSGGFKVGVHFFRSWTGASSVPVVIRIKTAKGINYYNAVVRLGHPVQIITQFNF